MARTKREDLIYGARVVIEALEAKRPIDKVMLRKGLPSDLRADVRAAAEASGVPVQTVPEEAMRRILPREANHQGVLAFVAPVAYQDLEQVLLRISESEEDPFIVVLDRVTDVRNFGAISRTAECMGAHALIIPQQNAAGITADALKVSAGALNHIPVCRVAHLQDAIHVLQAYQVRIVSCTEKAEKNIFEGELSGPLALVFGAEDTGITPRIIKSSDDHLKIPMVGKIASLNVSVSVSMVLGEAVRQRQYS